MSLTQNSILCPALIFLSLKSGKELTSSPLGIRPVKHSLNSAKTPNAVVPVTKPIILSLTFSLRSSIA
tara:strand:+ start:491 stop:694 length:204 start_codon:yes stop_codon:yes gene_type:complete